MERDPISFAKPVAWHVNLDEVTVKLVSRDSMLDVVFQAPRPLTDGDSEECTAHTTIAIPILDFLLYFHEHRTRIFHALANQDTDFKMFVTRNVALFVRKACLKNDQSSSMIVIVGVEKQHDPDNMNIICMSLQQCITLFEQVELANHVEWLNSVLP